VNGLLAVVGAGPKGIALAAKAHALAAAGYDVPRVVLVDRAGVAASWGGERGFTNGRPPLGTPPEKDIGFPYADSWGAQSHAVNSALAQFSWQRYLIERGLYADWVDHGRQRPTHRQWSAYLRAVAQSVEAEVTVDEVVALDVAGERWLLALDGGGLIEHVRRTVVLERDLCDRLATEAARRGVTFDELIAEYLAAGLGEAS
jgi:mycobactin lysine-N-oxygenase